MNHSTLTLRRLKLPSTLGFDPNKRSVFCKDWNGTGYMCCRSEMNFKHFSRLLSRVNYYTVLHRSFSA
jgi:hypothetical protein